MRCNHKQTANLQALQSYQRRSTADNSYFILESKRILVPLLLWVVCHGKSGVIQARLP
jgi:hypothetical protein